MPSLLCEGQARLVIFVSFVRVMTVTGIRSTAARSRHHEVTLPENGRHLSSASFRVAVGGAAISTVPVSRESGSTLFQFSVLQLKLGFTRGV